MMEPQSGTFKMLDDQWKNPEKFKSALTAIEEREGKPTLHVGEVVEVKGVRFTVQRIRAIGVLVLRMVPGQKWPRSDA